MKAAGRARPATIWGNSRFKLWPLGATALWSGLLTFGLARLLGLVTPLRADQEAEHDGMDLASHGERAYEFTN